jgi:hypothetical protein
MDFETYLAQVAKSPPTRGEVRPDPGGIVVRPGGTAAGAGVEVRLGEQEAEAAFRALRHLYHSVFDLEEDVPQSEEERHLAAAIDRFAAAFRARGLTPPGYLR